MLGVLLAAGCTNTAPIAPSLTKVTPDRGPADRAVGITLEGAQLRAVLITDFSRHTDSVLDSTFSGHLGREALREVHLNDDGTVSAIVPEGIAPGTYDVSLTVPGGNTATLAGGYRVLAANEVADLVASYRFAPIAGQQVGVPFTVTVTALDQVGTAVEGFNGVAQLVDLTGTVVPRSIGPFARGVWQGEVEVRQTHLADVLTVTSEGMRTGASNPFVVGAGAADRLVFATPPRSEAAGACSAAVTVQSVDATSAPSAPPVDVPVTLTAMPSAGFELFGDAACTVLLSAPKLSAGNAALTVHFRGTRAGAVQLTAAAGGLARAMQIETVTAGPASKLVFASGAPTLNSGTCSGSLTLQTRDGFDNPAPVTAATALTLDVVPAGGLDLFAADGCGTALTSLTMASGQASADLQVRGSTAGTFTLNASAVGLGSASLMVRVNPAGFPTQLVIVSTPQSVPVGQCSGPLAVQTQDAAGNAVTSPGAVPVMLSAAPATGFDFFDDAACTSPMTGLTLGVTASTGVIYFRGAQAGAVTVTAASAGLQSGVQTENLLAGNAGRLVFVSPAQTVPAGACSGEVVVGLQDALGNATAAAATTAVTLAASPAMGVTFFSDAACATVAAQLDIAVGQSSGRVYFTATRAGMLSLDAASAGLNPAQQVETISPAAATAVVFTSAPQTVGVGACSSAATLEARDAFGNAAMASAAVTLGAAPAAGFGFFSDPSCATAVATVPLTATATFFFRAAALGNVTVTAAPAGLMAAQQVEAVVAGSATRLAFTTPARSTPANGCSAAITVTAQDAAGNASPGAARSVTFGATALGFFSDAACTVPGATLTIAAGASSATFHVRGLIAGPYPLTASSAGLADGAQTEFVTPAAADRLAFVTPARTALAGACSAAVTVARQDPFGNDSPGAAATVALTAAPAAGFTFYSDAACTAAVSQVPLANAAAQTTFYFIGTVAQAETLTVASTPLLPASQAATITAAAAPTQLVFTTPARTVVAGTCSPALTVQARDSFNNPRSVAGNTAVALSGAATFYSDAACTAVVTQLTLGAGTDSASWYFRASVAGALPLTAAAAGLNPASQTETVTPASPDRLVFTSAAQTLPTGACSAAATVQPRDALGNVSGPGAAQTVTLTSGAGVTFYSDAACATAVGAVPLAAGATSATFYLRGTQAGGRTLSAAVTGWTAGTQPVTFTAAAPTQLVFTTPQRTVAAGGCSAVLTVESRDGFGNTTTVGAATPVTLAAAPATGFAFFSNSTCTAAAGTPSIAAGASTVSFYVRSPLAGAVTVTASSPGFAPASQSVTVTAGAPATLVFTTPSRSAVAGSCAQVLTVELRDAFDNVATAGASLTLNLAAAPSLGFAFHGNAACSMASGTASIAAGASQASFYFRGTSTGTVGVTVSSAGLANGTQNETVTAGGAASFAWDPVPGTVALGSAFGVTVRARDAFGNAATAFTGTAALSMAPAGTVSCTSPCTNATTTDAFAAGVWTGTVRITTAAAVGSNRTLTGTQGALNGTSNAFTVTGSAARSPPIARFTWSPAVINRGGTVNFDASTSSDYQTPTAQLQVSFDPENDGNFSAFTTTKTFSHRYDTAGLYRVRMEVRDTDGDLDYRSGWVRVLNAGDPRCNVNTASDTDDGATSCNGPNFGADGKLSLSEAVRLSNATPQTDSIVFATTMTITGTGSYDLDDGVNIYAQPGVILVGKSIRVRNNNTDVNIFGLEMSGQTRRFDVTSVGGNVVLTDMYLHDMPGVQNARATLTLEQVRMARCTQACVAKLGAQTGRIEVRYSELRDSPGQPAVDLVDCPGTGTALDFYSNTLSGSFSHGVRSACNGTLLIRQNTFDQLATGVVFAGGASHSLVDNIFSNLTVTAATCGTASFASRSYHVLFGNASNGCVNGDPNTLTSNPSYAFASAGDLRLAFGSPSINTAFNTGLDVCLGFPGDYLGSGPDRGGRESY